MPHYRVNKAGVAKARALIDDGAWDDSTEWSDAAPSAADENREIERQVNRAGLIHAKQRASQNDHDEIARAADDLLEHLDAKRS